MSGIERRHFLSLLASSTLASAMLGCGPTYVRGTEAEGIDDEAMSTGLDKRDLQKLLHDNLTAFTNGALADEWRTAGNKPQVAIYPIANETSEHVDSMLDALLSDVEAFLVDSQIVTVISLERQRQMMAEVNKQHGGGFDPSKIVEVNRQLGTEFYFTGKVFAADERTDDARRVQYLMHLQVIEVATSAVRWQNKAEVTKGMLT